VEIATADTQARFETGKSKRFGAIITVATREPSHKIWPWMLWPIWFPDGARTAFGSLPNDGLPDFYRKAANGSRQEDILYKSELPGTDDTPRPFTVVLDWQAALKK
jgi:hypothetical protein